MRFCQENSHEWIGCPLPGHRLRGCANGARSVSGTTRQAAGSSNSSATSSAHGQNKITMFWNLQNMAHHLDAADLPSGKHTNNY